jgi:type IV secretory pathway protease TraF
MRPTENREIPLPTLGVRALPVPVKAARERARHRPLPGWSGCRVLDTGEELLLTSAPASFDGRYFGATPIAHNLGSLVPLWTY